jgi:DNA-binding response OmpR family regulator
MEVQKKVLLIGENTGLCESLQRELAPVGYELAIIEDLGENLRGVIDGYLPDLIVIEAGDYAQGLELSLRVRKWAAAPILVLRTGSIDRRVRMMDLKSDTLYTEPFNTEELALIFWTTLFSSQRQPTCWS